MKVILKFGILVLTVIGSTAFAAENQFPLNPGPRQILGCKQAQGLADFTAGYDAEECSYGKDQSWYDPNKTGSLKTSGYRSFAVLGKGVTARNAFDVINCADNAKLRSEATAYQKRHCN